MDQTPQQESKQDSEVPIFSASTAEEDDDVEEYVEEEEEDEDIEEYDEEKSELRLDELAKEIRKFKTDVKKFKKDLSTLTSALDHFEKTNKTFRIRTNKEVTTLASKVDMVTNDQTTANDEINSLNAK